MRARWLLAPTIVGFLCTFGTSWADLIDGAANVTRSVIPPVVYTGGSPQIGPLDCFRDVHLGGNAQFTLNIGSPPIPWCKLYITNIDTYTGPSSGRGKQMTATGITSFWLYPGAKWRLAASPTGWFSDQPLDGTFGLLWFSPTVVTFFMDTGAASDTINDGLASGTSGAFKTINGCVTKAYNQVYVRTGAAVNCNNTASQAQSPGSIVQAFYQLPNGGVLQFGSATPGSSWTWNCPTGASCFQFGDNFLGTMTDITFNGTATSPSLITGHNIGVLDFFTNVTMVSANSGGNDLTCDFDTHFNINNGMAFQGAVQNFAYGCQGSSWNFNGSITASGSPAFGRFVTYQSGSKAIFQGNVSVSGFGTGSAAIATGNSVINNLSGANLPGGAGATATGGQFCTALC